MSYRKLFDPDLDPGGPDRADNYVYDDTSVLAVNAALVTGRPILVRGPSGTGKSSLAKSVARQLGWDFESEVITSTNGTDDLKWKIDYVGRLALAQAGSAEPEQLNLDRFVVPGPLWWAFDRHSAHVQHTRANQRPRPAERNNDNVVLLLDEIDKADPDLPNALLEPLEDRTFSVPGLEEPVHRQGRLAGQPETVLVFVTSNEERQLPEAILRRCLSLQLTFPGRSQMWAIAQAHGLAEHFDAVWAALFGEDDQMHLSTAEFLDTLRAFTELRTDSGPNLLQALSDITGWKHGKTPRR